MVTALPGAIAVVFVSGAQAFAGGNCGGAIHHCFAVGGPGCDDATCCDLVCASDPSCCSQAWDVDCVELALASCATTPCTVGCPAGSSLEIDPCGSLANSGCDAPPGSGSNCCVPNRTVSCDDPDCLNTVCGQDPFCCMVAWDQLCADLAIKLCPELCAASSPQFTTLPLGVTMCGGVAAIDGVRDHDWYAFTLPRQIEVTITLLSKTPIEIGVADNDGIPDCTIVTGLAPSVRNASMRRATAYFVQPPAKRQPSMRVLWRMKARAIRFRSSNATMATTDARHSIRACTFRRSLAQATTCASEDAFLLTAARHSCSRIFHANSPTESTRFRLSRDMGRQWQRQSMISAKSSVAST
ncbi:MAG: hypothetical protein SGJ11_15945 [Phycisphaerae bacterium]|nr:hypothetical protein [Phycisphaerae bacterium]